ncbi:hypothetical protein QYM41_16310 [Kocuria sp. CPCC 205268]|uniref:hypothetical protein n=1 Tax=Kocuria oxytropis TaxID=3058913 RepID=UPI0034D445CE
MTTDTTTDSPTSPAADLTVDHDEATLKLSRPLSTPVPTVTLFVSNSTSVEIDITDTTAPVMVDCQDVEEDEYTLEDLLGPELFQEAMSVTGAGATVRFRGGALWESLTRLAMEKWNLRWNPLPLSTHLSQAGTYVAARQTMALGGFEEAIATRGVAKPVLTTLARLDPRALPSQAREVVTGAVTTGRAGGLLEQLEYSADTAALPEPASVPDTAEVLLPADLGVATAGFVELDARGSVTELRGTPDWRLTGTGVFAPGEETLIARTNTTEGDGTVLEITAPLLVPVGRERAEQLPSYEAVLTEAGTGRLLGVTALSLSADGRSLTGRMPTTRPLEITDLLDVRIATTALPVRVDAAQRLRDRLVRDAARAVALERIQQAQGVQEDPQARQKLIRIWEHFLEELTSGAVILSAEEQIPKAWRYYAERQALDVTQRTDQHVKKRRQEKLLDSNVNGVTGLSPRPTPGPTLAELHLSGQLESRSTQRELDKVRSLLDGASNELAQQASTIPAQEITTAEELTDAKVAEILAAWSAEIRVPALRASQEQAPAPSERHIVPIDDETTFQALVGRARRRSEPWLRAEVILKKEGSDVVMTVIVTVPRESQTELLVSSSIMLGGQVWQMVLEPEPAQGPSITYKLVGRRLLPVADLPTVMGSTDDKNTIPVKLSLQVTRR